jgi:hypothetical protein
MRHEALDLMLAAGQLPDGEANGAANGAADGAPDAKALPVMCIAVQMGVLDKLTPPKRWVLLSLIAQRVATPNEALVLRGHATVP